MFPSISLRVEGTVTPKMSRNALVEPLSINNVRAIDADFLAGFIMTGMKDDASRDIFLSDVHLQ